MSLRDAKVQVYPNIKLRYVVSGTQNSVYDYNSELANLFNFQISVATLLFSLIQEPTIVNLKFQPTNLLALLTANLLNFTTQILNKL